MQNLANEGFHTNEYKYIICVFGENNVILSDFCLKKKNNCNLYCLSDILDHPVDRINR